MACLLPRLPAGRLENARKAVAFSGAEELKVHLLKPREERLKGPEWHKSLRKDHRRAWTSVCNSVDLWPISRNEPCLVMFFEVIISRRLGSPSQTYRCWWFQKRRRQCLPYREAPYLRFREPENASRFHFPPTELEMRSIYDRVIVRHVAFVPFASRTYFQASRRALDGEALLSQLSSRYAR